MFEGVLASVINSFLGKYIKDLDSQDLNLSIFSGNVELTNLQLKPEALHELPGRQYELELPIEVKAGYIGKITLVIPWSSLFSLPVIAKVEDVFVLAGPVCDRGYDEDRERALQNAVKRKKLEEIERARNSASKGSTAEDQTFFEKLVATIINNIQVHVENIHIRYEDTITNPDHPFAFGATLRYVSAESTDERWKPTQIDAQAAVMHKLAWVKDLSVYWNPYLPESKLVKTKISSGVWRNLMKNAISTHRMYGEEFDDSEFEYIMQPLSAELRAVINKADSIAMPRLLVDLLLGEIDVSVTRQQFLNLLSLADSFKLMSLNQRYRKYRPAVTLKGNTHKWWKYAYTSVVEEYIRPYSWERIKRHREQYRDYKAIFKKKLENPESEEIPLRLERMEANMSVANILLARENAKLEFIKEAPDRARKKEKEMGYFASFWDWWSSSGDSEDELEIITDEKDMWSKLSPEEKEELYKGIGYNPAQPAAVPIPPQYVAHKINLHLKSSSLSLANYGKDVLKIVVSSLVGSFENRPEYDAFRASMKTRAFRVEGASVEHELVPLVTSDVGVFDEAPSQSFQVFSLDFDSNPYHVRADYAVAVNVQPVEVVYDEHAISEVISFFEAPVVTMNRMKEAAGEYFQQLAVYSRAGLQYAIETHKTVHVSADMRSPYVVIPEHGTLHRPGNVLILDLGTLKIESELQPEEVNLQNISRTELETRLYDKFNINIDKVKILLADSEKDDWHTAQTKEDSNLHILPSIGLNMSFFNTVQPDYQELPRQKVIANLPGVTLNLSDKKISTLYTFMRNIPLPSPTVSPMVMDAVDGMEIGEPWDLDFTNAIIEPDMAELMRMSSSVSRNSVVKPKKKKKAGSTGAVSAVSVTRRSTGERFYDAEDYSDDEEMEEWSKAIDVPSVDDHSSPTNTITILVRFEMREVVVNISKFVDDIDTPYLMLRITGLQADAAVTVYGLAVNAKLRGLQLVDKLHTGPSGEYMEIIKSELNEDLMSVVYRQVSPECPEFDAIYRSICRGIVIHMTVLNIVFEREACYYLYNFTQALLTTLASVDMKSSTYSALSSPSAPTVTDAFKTAAQKEPEEKKEESPLPVGSTSLFIAGIFEDLTINMCSNDGELADLHVKGLESKIILKGNRTVIAGKLQNLTLDDKTLTTMYPRILTFEKEEVFNFKVTLYDKSAKPSDIDIGVQLRIGEVHVVFLYKFIIELWGFLDPFLNPEATDAALEATRGAIETQYQDFTKKGKKISLRFDIKAPTVWLPESSKSQQLFVARLGDLKLSNSYMETMLDRGQAQVFDSIYLDLSSVQIYRAWLKPDSTVELQHQIVEPISMTVYYKKAVVPITVDTINEFSGKLGIIKVNVNQQDLKLAMGILYKNLGEKKVTRSDVMEPKPGGPELDVSSGDTVVEEDGAEDTGNNSNGIKKEISANVVFEGTVLTLLNEDEENGHGLLTGENDSYSLSKFEIGKLNATVAIYSDKAIDVQVTLQEVSLEDTRKDSNLAVKRMFLPLWKVKKNLENAKDNAVPMVDFIYKQDSEGNQHIEMTVERIRLNVSMPYYLTVISFITDALRVKEHQTRRDSMMRESVRYKRSMSVSVLQPYVPEAQRKSKLTVRGRVKEPEVVLFASPQDPCSKVLFLKTDISLNYDADVDHNEMSAAVSDIQIVCCVYGQRKGPKYKVLHPCNLEFSRKVGEDGAVVMSAIMSSVDLHLCAGTVHILLDVIDMINKENKEEENTPDTSIALVQSDVWRVKTVTEDKWLQEEDEQGTMAFPPLPKAPPVESLKIDIKDVKVMFEAENLDTHVPMLCLRTKLEAEVLDWSKNLRLSAECHLDMAYYSDKLDTWEPLIEPVMEQENVYRPWEVLIKLIRAKTHPISCNYDENSANWGESVDGEMSHLVCRSKPVSDSSESEENETETDMRVIRPRISSRMSRTDSEKAQPENATFDEVDAVGGEEEEEENLCTYMVVNSKDKLLLNLTPVAMNVLKDVAGAFMKEEKTLLRSAEKKPSFEVYNHLGLSVEVTVSEKIKIHSSAAHDCTVKTTKEAVDEDESEWNEENEMDGEDDDDFDEVDGLSFLASALAKTANMAAASVVGRGVPLIPQGSEEVEPIYLELGQDEMHVKLEGFDHLYNLSHRRDSMKLLKLKPAKSNTVYCAVYNVNVNYGRKEVILQSPLKLWNHLSVSVDVLCKTEDLKVNNVTGVTPSGDQEYTKLAEIAPDAEYFVPLYIAYHCKLALRPTDLKYQRSYSELWWKDFTSSEKRETKYLSCLCDDGNQEAFYIKICCKPSGLEIRDEALVNSVPLYTFHIESPLVIHNYLPYEMTYCVGESEELIHVGPGDSLPVNSVDMQVTHKLKIQLPDYQGVEWNGTMDISKDIFSQYKNSLLIPMVTDVKTVDAEPKQLALNVFTNKINHRDLIGYAPYWIINKTGLPVQLRGSGSDAVFENDVSADPILFLYKKYKRQKVRMRIYNSKWSSSFSLDTVGSCGVVICNDPETKTKYQFMLQISLSQLKLTKIVTLTPYFMVVNCTQVGLKYAEQNGSSDDWIETAAGECHAFWPKTDNMKLTVKYVDSNVSSFYFSIKQTYTTVLRMNKGTALTVVVSGGTESPRTITFQDYRPGDAPVRIENLCEDVFLKIHQKDQSQVLLLSANQSMLYTWDDPTAQRVLQWNLYNRKKAGYEAIITSDGYGEVKLDVQTVRNSSEGHGGGAGDAVDSSSPEDDTELDDVDFPLLHKTRTDKVAMFWVSYLDGLQRVLLFTQDERIARKARKANEAEQASLAFFLSLDGVGLSLINKQYMEVAFVSLSSAPTIWEVEVNGKWKSLNVELATWLEDKYLSGDASASLEDFVEADLGEEMSMKKPYMGALRRTWRPALWFIYRQSQHHVHVHAKIHRVQIDNQLPEAYFPSVFYPSPMPQHVLRRTGPKPFIEMSVMRRTVPENGVDSIKKLKVLMQEFNLKLDKGFLESVYDVVSNVWEQKNESVQLNEDLDTVRASLKDTIKSQVSSSPHRIVFEYLHLSPLKIRISFSLAGKAYTTPKEEERGVLQEISSDIVGFFFQSVGVTLTEIREVEIRMAYFTLNGAQLTWDQLVAEITSHYKSQAIQQAYVFILGLDVLGNPYGLIKDFTEGLGDFFYEPFMGSIEGPEEFTQGLVRGVESLLGHTVGGAAGSVALVTGSFGRALAFLSFDEDYKKKRRQRMQQHPKSLPSSLVLAGKTFVMGVALGLSGVVVSPAQGCSEDGVEGFFKGIGKGLLGLLTKPTGGVVDMVSVSFDGIRRAAEMGEDVVVRIRLPRYINPILGLKPYSPYQALGLKLLQSLAKGKYTETDVYIAHAALSAQQNADVVVITDRRVLLLDKCKFWGDWDIEWDVLLKDVISTSDATKDQLIIHVIKDDGETVEEKVISCEEEEILQWLERKLERARKMAKVLWM